MKQYSDSSTFRTSDMICHGNSFKPFSQWEPVYFNLFSTVKIRVGVVYTQSLGSVRRREGPGFVSYLASLPGLKVE